MWEVGEGGGRGAGPDVKMFAACTRLEFHVGWSGWTRPPTLEGGGEPPQANRLQKGGGRGV